MPENALPRSMHPVPLVPRQQLHDGAESSETRPDRAPSEPGPGRVDSGVRDGGGEGGEVQPRDKGVFGSDQRRDSAAVELHKGGGDDKGEGGE